VIVNLQSHARTSYLNQSILAKAFRGELVPQDPNDEPASVLLERIKAERDKQEGTGKKAKKKESKVQQLNLDL
jgi:type I restriction enzyme S subunit